MFIADLSKYQPKNINFTALKALVDFVILRDQFGYTIADENYNDYVKGCEAAGLPFNTYAFFDAVNVSDAIAEADADIKKMTTKNQVAWIDIETVSVKSGTDSDLQAAANAYYDELKKAGFQKVGLYSGEYFYNTHKLYNVKHDCLWLAKYNSNDGKLNLAERPATPCDLWQFTSVGSLAGISPLDLSVIVGSKPLTYFTGAADFIPLSASVPDLFCMQPDRIGKVRSISGNDIRRAPSHKAGYVRNTVANEVFDLYEKVENEGDTWFAIGGANWICSNNGNNARVLEIYPPKPTPPAPPVAPPPVVEIKVQPAAPVAPAPPAMATAAAAAPAPIKEEAPSVIQEEVMIHINTPQKYLQPVIDYLTAKKTWWFEYKLYGDAALIDTGIFIVGSPAYEHMTDFLKTEGYTWTETKPS